MRRTSFSNAPAWWIVLVTLYGLLLWYVALGSVAGDIMALMHSVLIGLLLYLIYTGRSAARSALQVWTILALILSPVFKGISKILIARGNSQSTLEWQDVSGDVIMLSVGVVLLFISLRYMEVKEVSDHMSQE